jgi:uncharacterized protein YciI
MSSPKPAGSAADRQTFVVVSLAGPHRDRARDTRAQPFWDEHATFIDRLVDEGFILMGGPLVDDGGAMLIVRATDEAEVTARLQDDPWYREGILRQQSIKRWQIFIDERR